MPQPLFKGRQQRDLVARMEIDDAIGVQASLSDGGGEEIGFGHAPQYLAGKASHDARSKESRGRRIHGPRRSASNFVQGTQCETTARKTTVDRIYAKWQCAIRASTY